MQVSFKIKDFLKISIAFILFTVIGTVSHEYGHIAAAEYLGYETQLHYASMNYYPEGCLEDEDVKQLKRLVKGYRDMAYEDWPENIKQEHQKASLIIEERYYGNQTNNRTLITLGGPLQTILTGVLGLLILYWRRASIKRQGLKLGDWLGVFLALFWLREVFNLSMGIAQELIAPDGYWFGGDEVRLSIRFDLWEGTVPIILGLLGLICSCHVVFNVLPKSLRLRFILGGAVGGSLGFYLWMFIAGPQLLP